MFDQIPEDEKELKDLNEHLTEIIEEYLFCIESGYRHYMMDAHDSWNDVMYMQSGLDDMNETLKKYEAELHFLGRFVSETKTEIPLEDHPINFGQYLLKDDPRRYAIRVHIDPLDE